MAGNFDNKIIVTPAGRALYPKLTEPDTKFKPEGEYSVKLILNEAEALRILEQCKEIQQRALEEEVEAQVAKNPKMNPDTVRKKIKLADLPVKPYEDPETGEETGEYQATFKMAASGVSKKTGKEWTRRPALFDAANQPIKNRDKLQIWSGSTLKVGYTMSPFCTSAVGAGVSLRMEAVQILELVSGGARDAEDYGFTKEDGGYTHDGDACSGSVFGSGAAADGEDSAESDF